MNHRKPCKALDHEEVRELSEAAAHAKRLGCELRTTINVSPHLMAEYPTDMRAFFDAFLNKLRIWCARQGFGFYAIAVRENFDGDRREHFHVLLYTPPGQRSILEEAVRRWLPGPPEVVTVRRVIFKTDRFGRQVNKALTYMMKQMTPQACFSLCRKVRRQKVCPKTGARVAPVLGKRYYISRTLDAKARQYDAIKAASGGPMLSQEAADRRSCAQMPNPHPRSGEPTTGPTIANHQPLGSPWTGERHWWEAESRRA